MPLEGFYPVQQSIDFIREGDQQPRQGPDLEARNCGNGSLPLSPAVGLGQCTWLPWDSSCPGYFSVLSTGPMETHKTQVLGLK